MEHSPYTKEKPALEESRFSNVSEFPSHFDLNINTAGKLNLHKSIHSLGAVGVDINQPLVSAKLKLFSRFFVDVRRLKYRKLLLLGWKRNWTDYYGPGRFYRLYYFF